MRHLEIYGYEGSRGSEEAKTFCQKAGYAFVFRNVRDDSLVVKEMIGRMKTNGPTPQIFIGEEQIGTLRDLMSIQPFIMQQKISG